MNQLQANILKELVNPAIRKIKKTVVGYIAVVYLKERKIDVYYKDMDGATRLASKLDFPKYGDGVFTEGLKAGDIVELSYRNQAQNDVFVTQVIKRNQSEKDFSLTKGSKLPKSVDLY